MPASARSFAGGKYDDSVGYFIQPTVVETKAIPLYQDHEGRDLWPRRHCLRLLLPTTLTLLLNLASTLPCQLWPYWLKSFSWQEDRNAAVYASNKLTHAAGNFYISDTVSLALLSWPNRCFPVGARASGTNITRGGSVNLLYRFVSPALYKGELCPPL